MGGLEPGTYTPNLDVEVSVWNDPDKDGDGTPVLDEYGDPTTDAQGNVIKRYNPPAGFVNKAPVNEHGVVSGENYVLQDENRQIVRDVDGNSIAISEGQAVVRHQDGTVEVLADEASKRRFSKGYSKQSGPSTAPGASKLDTAPKVSGTGGPGGGGTAAVSTPPDGAQNTPNIVTGPTAAGIELPPQGIGQALAAEASTQAEPGANPGTSDGTAQPGV